MNLRQIRYFCVVVEAGSAAHAAQRLHVAPTAISMQLAQLETHLGGDLFDRSRRPMELTELGKFFYPRAQELLTQAQRLEDETRGIAAGSHGWLGVAFARTSTFSILPRAIRLFRDAYPQVQLDLVEAVSEYQPEQLRQGRIDIGISRFLDEIKVPADLQYTTIMDDPLIAALPLGHPLAQRPSLSLADFASVPFILYPKDMHSPFSQQILGILRQAGVTPNIACSAMEIYTTLSLIGAGLGGTLVPRSIAETKRPDVAFVPISDIHNSTTMVAITRANEDNKLVKAFLAILSSSAQD